MKVLIVANYKRDMGGIAAQIDHLYSSLKEENVDVDIFSTKGNIIERILMLFTLIMKGRKHDVFHIHACSNFGFFPIVLGVIVGKLLRKKIVSTYHGGGAAKFFDKHYNLVRFFLIRVDINIVLSGFVGAVFDKYAIPYVIIPNIMDVNVDCFRERKNLTPTFISIRTLTPTYNIPCIIRAFEIVVSKKAESKLMILADGSSRAELEAMVEDRKIPNIDFVGRVPNSEIYNYLNQADVFISSPVIDNQPMSVLEGFNAGLLVISSNVGGVPYLVEDERTGLLFESDNHIELSDRMLWGVNHFEDALKIVENAKLEVQKYSVENIIPQIVEIYNNLC